MKTNNWDKFCLLTWKNWKIQWQHKWHIIIEIVLPTLFMYLLYVMRAYIKPQLHKAVLFEPVYIDNLPTNVTNMELAYSPKNVHLEAIINGAASKFNLNVTSHSDAKALETYLENNDILAGVQFNDLLASITTYPTEFKYSLRFPAELRTHNYNNYTWVTDKYVPNDPTYLSGARNENANDGGLPPGYIRENFIAIQNALSLAFIKLVANSGDLTMPEIVMQRHPFPSNWLDPLLELLKSMMPIVVMLSFISPCANVVKQVTIEKEKQLKEVMKIMGLHSWIHWCAWFVKSFLLLGCSIIIMVVILKWRNSDDQSVLIYTNWFPLLVFFLAYAIAMITFSFFLSTLFSRASIASPMAGLICIISYLLYLVIKANSFTLLQKLCFCLIPNTAMSYGLKLIVQLEQTRDGLQWSTLFKPISEEEPLAVGLVIVAMLISAIMYMIICLYIEQIMPGEFGVPQKWYFPLTKRFWCGELTEIDDLSNDRGVRSHEDGFEREPVGKRVGLHVKNLRKVFEHKVAVNNVSMNMYEDEITVLLGHNGAGKTTTISMLTGMFPPTSGTAVINGSDIRTNIEGARMSLGICPQHNILFDDLTVRDHIVFFSRLKGLKRAAVVTEVQKYVRILQLENKINVASSKLSGGMKRKLSIGAALCGGTKVVLCDEPSSGMDPAARRQLWDLLQAEKVGRTILLTTHFMDEADVLGDRIAIMCDGDLKCYGTSFFLKKKFGSGYILICETKDNCDSNQVMQLLRNYIPNLEVKNEIGSELSFQLADEYSKVFESMFEDLESKSEDLNLKGYGVSITALEEVFMRVGAEKEIQKTSIVMDDVEEIDGSTTFLTNSAKLLAGYRLLASQWKAMFVKKFSYAKRNRITLLFQMVIPILCILMSFIGTSESPLYNLKPLPIRLDDYQSSVTVLQTSDNVTKDVASIAKQYKTIVQEYGNHHKLVEIDSDFQDYMKNISDSVTHRYLVAATLADEKFIAWFNNEFFHTAPLALNLLHNAMAKAYLGPSYSIAVTNAPLPFTVENQLNHHKNAKIDSTDLVTYIPFSMCFVTALYALFVIRERTSRNKLLQFVSGVGAVTFWLSQFLWDMMTHTIGVILMIIVIAVFQLEGYSTFTELGTNFVLLLLFGLNVLPYTYFIAGLFAQPASGFIRLTTLNFFTGPAVGTVYVLISSCHVPWYLLMLPLFTLTQGLGKLRTASMDRISCRQERKSLESDCNVKPYFGWECPGILPEIVYFLGGSIVFFAILLILEYGYIQKGFDAIIKLVKKPKPIPVDDNIDDDVEREQNQIATMDLTSIKMQNLVLNKVSKDYYRFTAVNKVSVMVKPKECFGLLGVNGAGKTTTFQMLTGDQIISSGHAYVNGYNLKNEMRRVYTNIGYCPQFDALLDDLTGRETVRIFCLLRGIPSQDIPSIVEECAELLGFGRHLDKQTKSYSGGNKRKLSTAIALIGSPSVVYLDEPTTGMDPAARRHLWNVLCRVRDSGKSIVLTSHSMEECEALCTRLAIMVNGEFKCIGSTQHLKNKFSKGLVLKIKLKRDVIELARRSTTRLSITSLQDNSVDAVKIFVRTQFADAVLQEEYQGMLTFYIPLASSKWSNIFGLMEKNRDILNVEDYSVSQTTLEQIFLQFAKSQRNDPRDKRTTISTPIIEVNPA